MFNQTEYREKINLKNEVTNDIAGLRLLYLAHLRNFTFENLDCLLDREIKINTQDIFNKIILKNRGGYCFELNLFFKDALTHFGFKAEVYLARVFYRGDDIKAKTHLTVMVDLPSGKYLADAGFGGPGPEDLLKFELNTIQKVGSFNFRILEDRQFGFMVQRETNNEFKNVFAFTLDTVYPADLEMSNFYVSKLSTSAFRSAFNLCRFTETGRMSALNNQLNIVHNGQLTTETIPHFEEWYQILNTKFKISLTTDELILLKSKWDQFTKK